MPRRRESISWVGTVAMAGCALCSLASGWSSAGSAARPRQAEGGAEASRKEIEAFNRKFIAAHLKMDNLAVMSMWAEDGVSLLPATEPMVGKQRIAKFMDDVVAQMPGYHMAKIDVEFQGIEVRGDWALEWALEHQVVQPSQGKPVFDSYGKLLLVLHKDADGNWRIAREMWNQGMKP